MSVAGEIDLYTAPRLHSELMTALSAATPGAPLHLVVDMTGVEFCDSTGMNVLLAAHRRAREDGGDLQLAAPRLGDPQGPPGDRPGIGVHRAGQPGRQLGPPAARSASIARPPSLRSAACPVTLLSSFRPRTRPTASARPSGPPPTWPAPTWSWSWTTARPTARPRRPSRPARASCGTRATAARPPPWRPARRPSRCWRRPPTIPHHLLFLDADLGETAAQAGPLAEPVRDGTADMTIAVFSSRVRKGGFGLVMAASGAGIERATGWRPAQPLNGQRCLTRAAFEAALPLAAGWGAETGLTIDLLRKGLRVTEVDVPLAHRATGNDWRSQVHRARQLAGVARALAVREPGTRRAIRDRARRAARPASG